MSNKEDDEKPIQVPLCMINSRSRARKQKQSAALNRISPAPIPQTTNESNELPEIEQPNIDEVNEPEPINVESDPLMMSIPIVKHDFSLTSTSNSDQTAEFLDKMPSTKPIKMASAKANKMAAPIVNLESSEKETENFQTANDQQPLNVTTIIEQTEIARKSLSIDPKKDEKEIDEPEKENEELPEKENDEESEKELVSEKPKKSRAKAKPKSQPLSRPKKAAAKKKTLPVKLEDVKVEKEEDQKQQNEEAGRSRRKAAPMNLAEPKLNKKMRRE